VRLLVDLTNSPHVPFFAPLVRELESRGHEVVITARRFAQTLELAKLHGLDATVIGSHGGTSRLGKARAAIGRTWSLDRFVGRSQRAGGRFDAALSHGSTDLPLVARRRGIPHVTIFDYEWARTQHRLNCRMSWRVAVPDSIPLERLDEYGAAGRAVGYPGLKEEYYLDPAALDPAGVRAALAIDMDQVLVVLRPPAAMALYHRGITNDVFGAVLDRVRATEGCVAVVLPRTPEQRVAIKAMVGRDPRVVIPRTAIDGASLVAAADLVVSAGGTMNREAAALGVPVYTVFAGRMGGVDEQLVAEGRLALLTSADDVLLARRASRGDAPRLLHDRSPSDLLDVLLAGIPVLEPAPTS
jgi:predicted glycosyltransferase